jgi:hypothetical protein
MDPGFRSPLVDYFRRGEVGRDVRLLAARAALAPRAHEQLAILILLSDDADPEVAGSALATLDRLPEFSLKGFLARADVPGEMRAFFVSRGIAPADAPAPDADEPLLDAEAGQVEARQGRPGADPQVLSQLSVLERMKLAIHGTREHRAHLIRDANRLVAVAVLSSPKLTDAEVEAFSKTANVSEDVLRIIGSNRSWLKNYGVVLGLAKNPKTPPGISLHLLHRINERDVRMLAMDRNVAEPVRLAARKMVAKALG